MSESGYSLGIDLGGTTIKFAVIDETGAIVANDRIATDGEDGHQAVISRMAASASRLLTASTICHQSSRLALPCQVRLTW